MRQATGKDEEDKKPKYFNKRGVFSSTDKTIENKRNN
jgi:hypothetical protein